MSELRWNMLNDSDLGMFLRSVLFQTLSESFFELFFELNHALYYYLSDYLSYSLFLLNYSMHRSLNYSLVFQLFSELFFELFSDIFSEQYAGLFPELFSVDCPLDCSGFILNYSDTVYNCKYVWFIFSIISWFYSRFHSESLSHSHIFWILPSISFYLDLTYMLNSILNYSLNLRARGKERKLSWQGSSHENTKGTAQLLSSTWTSWSEAKACW